MNMTTAKRTTNTIFKIAVLSILIIAAAALYLPSESSAATKKTTLKTKSATIYVNGKYTISLKNKLKNATYFYTSNKTSIAKVSAKGAITGCGKGTAKISVRYKYKKEFKSVGTFKVTVKKASLKSSYKKFTATVGDVFQPSDYLNSVNKSAEYLFTNTSSKVASAVTSGAITCLKSGYTNLSIHEVYNKKSRTIGHMELTVMGASLRADSFKLAYLKQLPIDDIVENIDSTATYSFTSDHPELFELNDSGVISTTTGNTVQTSNITLTETTPDGIKRVLGTFKVELTNEPFISASDQSITVGLGSTIQASDYEGISITNPRASASYFFTPKDTNIISNDMVAVNYGTTTVEVKEYYNNQITTLSETVQVTVTTASIKKSLSLNGFTTMVDGDVYGDYPVDCRNHTKLYHYESANTSICTVTTGGDKQDQDYLVISPLKVGITSISVYETVSGESDKTKIGSFKVTVKEDTSDLPDLDTLKASQIFRSIAYTHNDKTINGVVNTNSLSCSFYDSYGGYIDYGTDFSSLTAGSFTYVLKKSKYKVTNIETIDGGMNWTFTIDLGDTDHTLVNVPVTLSPAQLDTSTIIDNIVVKLGTTTNRITDIKAADSSFETTFTTAQYIAAGATEYSNTAVNPVALSDLTNVTCTVTQKTYNAVNTPNANIAVKHITEPATKDNKTWMFTVTFEDGTSKDYTVTLGLKK